MQVVVCLAAVGPGTRFDYPALVDDYILYAGGTLNGEGVVVTGGGRRQEGVFIPNDGIATLTGATFAGLQYGVLVEDGGRATLNAPVLTGSNINAAVRGVGQLTLSGATISGADPAAPSTGLMTQYARVGVGLSAKDTHFDLGPADRPFRFDLEAFAAGSTVTLSGTTFEDGEHGLGYRVGGQSNVAAVITLGPLEPAQPDYVVEGLTGVYGSATLQLIPDTLLRSATVDPATLRADDTATMTLSGITVRDVSIGWQHSANGSVTSSTLEGAEPGDWALLWTTSSAALPITGSTLTAIGTKTTSLQGVWASGAGNATVTSCALKGLACGLTALNGGTVTAVGSTNAGNARDRCP